MKVRAQAAIIAGGLVVILYQVFFNWGDSSFSLSNLVWGAMLGVIVATIAFVVVTIVQNNQGGKRK